MQEYNVNIKIFGKEFKSKMMANNATDAHVKAKQWLASQAIIRVTPEPNQEASGFMDFFNSIVNKKS